MRNLFLICFLAIAVLGSGCSSKESDNKKGKAPAEKKQVVQEKKISNPLKTKDGLEKKLSELGVAIYSGAEFIKVKYANDEYTISYKIPEITQQSKADVNTFYENVYKKLESDGWNKFSENRPIFQKGREHLRFSHSFMRDLNIHAIYITYAELT